MTCRELTDLLADYLDGELSPAQRVDLEDHLANCPFCRDYLDSYRKTIELEKTAFDQPEQLTGAQVPPELMKAVLAARRNSADK